MQTGSISVGRMLRAVACAAALVAAMPAASRAAEAVERADLERQLQEARRELDTAAREVAELSRQLYGGESGDVLRFVRGGAGGSMLGINIGGAANRDDGVEVMGVSPGGPAEQAGLKTGDVVTAVDGKPLRRSGEQGPRMQLVELMRSVPPGRVVKVDYLRDGRKETASVTTAPAEPPVVRMLRERLGGPRGEAWPLPPGVDALLGPGRGFHALELVALTPKLGAYFGTDRGLLVVRAPQDAGLPLEEGDVLQSIDGRTPESPGHAFRILNSYQPGEKLKLGVLRHRKPLTLEATLPAREGMDGAHLGRRPAAPPSPRPAPPAPRAEGAPT